MAALQKIFTQALLTIKAGSGRLLGAYETYFEVNYETVDDMLSDALVLNQQGYTTRMDRQFFNMTVTI